MIMHDNRQHIYASTYMDPQSRLVFGRYENWAIMSDITDCDISGDIWVLKFRGYEIQICNIQISIWISIYLKYGHGIISLPKLEYQG
jgi:hypothetical protein